MDQVEPGSGKRIGCKYNFPMFTKNPSKHHTKVVKTILQYFKGFKEQEITSSNQEELWVEEYSDLS